MGRSVRSNERLYGREVNDGENEQLEEDDGGAGKRACCEKAIASATNDRRSGFSTVVAKAVERGWKAGVISTICG